MVAMAKVHAAQARAASHFLDKLHRINQTYISGGENIQFALNQFDSEWQQIRSWQHWSAQNRHEDASIAKLCAQYPLIGRDLLVVRLAFDERVQWCEASLDASYLLDDPELIVQNLLDLAAITNAIGDSQAAIDRATEVFAYYPESSGALVVGQAYYIIAESEMARGNIPAAHDYFQKSLEILQHYQEMLRIADVQYNLSAIAGRMGDYDAAVNYVEQALPVFERHNKVIKLGNSYNTLALVARMRNQLTLSIETHRKSIAYYESVNFAAGLSMALANLATVLAIDEQYDEAENVANRSLKLAQLAGSKRAIVDAYLRLARLYTGRAQYEEGEYYVTEAVKVSETLDHPYALTICFQTLAYIAQEQGRFDDALGYIERGLPIARAAEDNYAVAYFQSNIATIYRLQGDFQTARQALYDGLIPAKKSSSQAQMQFLLDAVKTWCDAGDFEDAIRWVGLLETLQVTAVFKADVESYREKLAAQVPPEQFEAWYSDGQTLSVEDGLAELKQLLENGG